MPIRSPLRDLPDQDRKRFYDITLGFMCVAASSLFGRTVGDALFLERYSAADLAYTYPATAFAISIVAYGYGRGASRWPLARLVTVLTLSLVTVCLVLRSLMMVHDAGVARIAAYLIGDLVVNLPMILFWSFAAQCFIPGQAKRLFGLIGAGGTTACILAGFVVRPFSAAFGTPNLLILIALLLLGFVVTVRRISKRDEIGRQAPPVSGGSGLGSFTSLMTQRQVKAIVFLMLVSTIVLTLVDYQFKAGARLNLDPSELASFFGSFYGLASAVALIIQLFAVHRILQTGGVFAGLAIMPAALCLTSLAAWVSGSFEWSVATKFAVQVFAFTIDSAAIQMLYLGIARQTRSQARALAEGIGKPLATGLTGLALILIADPAALHRLAFTASACSLMWLFLTRQNHNAYIQSLVESLGDKKFDVSQETASFRDLALEAHIRKSLDSATDEEVVYLLGILPTLDESDWSEAYRSMASRQDSRIIIAALCYLKDNGDEQDIEVCLNMLDHEDPNVRETAIDSLSALADPEHAGAVEPFLRDKSPETRAAAIALMINTEDLDRLLTGGAELREMLASEDRADRVAAAHALGRLKRGGLLKPIIGLLQDPDTQVLRAALEACLANRDPKLIPAIVPLLSNPSVATLAGDTLAAYGQITLDHLIPYIELAEEEEEEGTLEVAHEIPSILSRIGDPVAFPGLEKAARASDPLLRTNAIRAFTVILVKTNRVKERRPDIEALAIQEMTASRENRNRASRLGDTAETSLLKSALEQVAESHLGNTFLLLDILVPSVEMQQLYRSLKHPGEERDNATEVLENILKGKLRSEITQTIRTQPAKAGGDTIDVLIEVMESQSSDWVKVGAAYAIGHMETAPFAGLHEDLRHRHPVVRETALYALATRDKKAVGKARHLVEDESAIVRSLAECILNPKVA